MEMVIAPDGRLPVLQRAVGDWLTLEYTALAIGESELYTSVQLRREQRSDEVGK